MIQKYQQSGGYKEDPSRKTYFINDTIIINVVFSSVQKNIAEDKYYNSKREENL